MSDLKLTKTGPNSGVITVSVCRLGDFITSGRTGAITIPLEDSESLRRLSANLNKLKSQNFNGAVAIAFPGVGKIAMDQSIWRDLCDALFGFSLCVDIANLVA